MAIVPFRVSGPAASQQTEQQFLQIGTYSLLLQQRPQDSGNVDHLHNTQQTKCRGADLVQQEAQQTRAAGLGLSRVGLVLWQSGYVLADFLLLRLPHLHSGRLSSWAGTSVLELGCGAGTVGLFLALAGAQVVLTDQPHILPLTECNLELNFPATSTGTYSTSSRSRGRSSAINSCHLTTSSSSNIDQQSRTFGRRSEPVQQRVDDGVSLTTAAHTAPSALAAFAAAFSQAQHHDAAAAQTPTAQLAAPGKLCEAVFTSGPLVVEHTWGETWGQLQMRVCSAADARLARSGQVEQQQAQQQAHTIPDDVDATPPPPGICSPAPQQLGPEAPSPEQLDCCFDVVVGADLLYDVSCHAALLQSLDSTCSPHTQVYMCYRTRGLGEELFEEAAAAA
eukprot:gene205-399_t